QNDDLVVVRGLEALQDLDLIDVRSPFFVGSRRGRRGFLAARETHRSNQQDKAAENEQTCFHQNPPLICGRIVRVRQCSRKRESPQDRERIREVESRGFPEALREVRSRRGTLALQVLKPGRSRTR